MYSVTLFGLFTRRTRIQVYPPPLVVIIELLKIIIIIRGFWIHKESQAKNFELFWGLRGIEMTRNGLSKWN